MFDLKDVEKNTDQLQQTWLDQFSNLLEMGQIKSDIDCVLLTAGREGEDSNHLIASKFHFVSRQLRFSISEGNRYDIELIELREKEKYFSSLSARLFFLLKPIIKLINLFFRSNFPTSRKLELRKIQNSIKTTQLELFNQLTRTKRFVETLKKLEEINGKPFTNEQFQQEQTEYYNWFIRKELIRELIAKRTGISKGLIEAEDLLSKPSLFPEVSQPIDKLLDLSGISFEKIRTIKNIERFFPETMENLLKKVEKGIKDESK